MKIWAWSRTTSLDPDVHVYCRIVTIAPYVKDDNYDAIIPIAPYSARKNLTNRVSNCFTYKTNLNYLSLGVVVISVILIHLPTQL